MQKLRLLPLAILSLSVGLMTACDSTSSSTVPSIDRVGLDNTSIVAGQGSTGIHSTVTSEATGFTVTFAVTDSTGKDVTSDFTIPFKNPASSDTKWVAVDAGATLSAKSTAASGTYTLKLTVASSSGSNSASVTFTVTGGTSGTPLTSKGTLSVGGFSASAGSFIGLSPVQAYHSSETSANHASIDLVVTANADGSASVFESTAEGVTNGDLTSSYWGSGRATLIQAVSSAPTTQAAAAAALTSTSQTANITQGGIYVAKTVDGTYAVLTASGVSGVGDAVTLTVTVLE